MSDVSWDNTGEEKVKNLKKDSKIQVVVLGSNHEKERISLGIKQLDNKNFKSDLKKLKTGETVSAFVVNVKKDMIELELDIGIKAVIKKLDIGKDKNKQNIEEYAVGDKIEGKIIKFNDITGKLSLSIKEFEAKAKESYVYSNQDSSGSTLGSILGGVLEESRSRMTQEQSKLNDKEDK
jgi:small subunit ribosomal protein S1